MELTVNGKAHTHRGDGSIDSLLSELKASGDRVALMVNNHVVRREKRQEVALHDGDTVEVLAFAGGG